MRLGIITNLDALPGYGIITDINCQEITFSHFGNFLPCDIGSWVSFEIEMLPDGLQAITVLRY